MRSACRVFLFLAALPLFAEKLPPAFRADADHYREPRSVVVEASVLASPDELVPTSGSFAW